MSKLSLSILLNFPNVNRRCARVVNGYDLNFGPFCIKRKAVFILRHHMTSVSQVRTLSASVTNFFGCCSPKLCLACFGGRDELVVILLRFSVDLKAST